MHVSACVCESLSRLQLFATSQTVACQASLCIQLSRQEYGSRLSFPSSEDLPNPGIKPQSPASQADSLPSEPQGWVINNAHNTQFSRGGNAPWLQNLPWCPWGILDLKLLKCTHSVISLLVTCHREKNMEVKWRATYGNYNTFSFSSGIQVLSPVAIAL